MGSSDTPDHISLFSEQIQYIRHSNGLQPVYAKIISYKQLQFSAYRLIIADWNY